MNVWTPIIIAALGLLLGGTGGGAIVAWRKDARQAPIDKATAEKADLDADKARLEVAAMVEKLANGAVQKADQELEKQEQRHNREMDDLRRTHRREMDELRAELTEKVDGERAWMMRRIGHLEQVMSEGGLTVPPWQEPRP